MTRKSIVVEPNMEQRLLSRPSRIVSLSVFIALSIIIFFVEAQFAVSGAVPTVKFGFANILVMLVLYYYGPSEALIVAMGRVVGSALLGGTLLQPVFLFSLAGAVVSFAAIVAAYQFLYPALSFIGISVFGAVLHNLAQMGVAAVLIGSGGIWNLLPLLLVSGALFGTLNGIAVNMVTAKLEGISL